jgi:two-component system nitrogen regulation response regulator NtrX
MTDIAIVDNDPALVSLLRELFEERGWESASYADVDGAMSGLKLRVPDLVFLDIWLDTPNSGWYLLRQLKQDPELRSLPIIVCSGAAEHLLEKEDWLREHGIPVLYKPFDIDEVYQLVEQTIANSVPGKLER